MGKRWWTITMMKWPQHSKAMKNSRDPLLLSQDDTSPPDSPEFDLRAPKPHCAAVRYVLYHVSNQFPFSLVALLPSFLPPPPSLHPHLPIPSTTMSQRNLPSPGIYAVIVFPLLNFTFAVLRSPLFGFFGFTDETRRQTPFIWGRLASAGDTACRARAFPRGWRKTCMRVVERGAEVESGRARERVCDWAERRKRQTGRKVEAHGEDQEERPRWRKRREMEESGGAILRVREER